eukprot:4424310-Amphidinium_carterae.1
MAGEGWGMLAGGGPGSAGSAVSTGASNDVSAATSAGCVTMVSSAPSPGTGPKWAAGVAMELEGGYAVGRHVKVARPKLWLNQNGDEKLTWRQSACTSSMVD